jgi:hypothetical protein
MRSSLSIQFRLCPNRYHRKKETNDTILIGGMIIIKKPGNNNNEVITGEKTVEYLRKELPRI